MTTTLVPREAYALWAASYPAYAHNPLMQAEERAMLALVPANLRGLSILDAGCGSGRYLRYARERGARQLVGVDLSWEMLVQAIKQTRRQGGAKLPTSQSPNLLQGSLDALPLVNGWADLTICGLTIGHLEALQPALGELQRVTRPGGTILISDFHPIGEQLGWRREFRVGAQRYAVRHTARQLHEWQQACSRLGLQISSVVEPRLDPDSIPAGAQFDHQALEVPVAMVLELRVTPPTNTYAD
jgi:malonyl-CoA O-methyltransferase